MKGREWKCLQDLFWNFVFLFNFSLCQVKSVAKFIYIASFVFSQFKFQLRFWILNNTKVGQIDTFWLLNVCLNNFKYVFISHRKFTPASFYLLPLQPKQQIGHVCIVRLAEMKLLDASQASRQVTALYFLSHSRNQYPDIFFKQCKLAYILSLAIYLLGGQVGHIHICC